MMHNGRRGASISGRAARITGIGRASTLQRAFHVPGSLIMFWTRASRGLTATLLLGLLSLGGRAQAAIAEVRDEAHFFSADAVAHANDSIKEIKQRYKKDLLIETVRQVPEDKR